jgi:hypothetical protein
MIEEPLEAKHYRDAQRLALTRLRDLEVALQQRLRTPLKYRMVSQAQAAPAERAYFLWNRAGAISPQPAFDAAKLVFGEVTPETLAKSRYGSGMIVSMRRGQGEILTAASCEWVMGLKRGCFYTEQITRNILNRFTL